MSAGGDYQDVLGADEVAPGTTRAVEIAGFALLICRVGDEYFAIENKCSHAGTPMTRGRLRGDCILCPVHGARFQLRDGKHLTPPAATGLRTFKLRVEGGRLLVDPTPIDPPPRPGDVP